MSDRNSPAIQHYLQDTSDLTGDGQSIEKRTFDHHCPDAVTKGLNSYRTSCESRLRMSKPPSVCRRCEVAEKVAQEAGIELKRPKKQICSSTSCTTPADKGFQTCTEHRAYARERHHTHGTQQRHCKECDAEIGKGKYYCAECLRLRYNERQRIMKAKKNGPRKCKTCGVVIGKGMKYCATHSEERAFESNKAASKKYRQKSATLQEGGNVAK